jgi:NADH dehydrogenase
VAFLPFNIARQKRLKVVIVGGGYAGLAALTNLLQFAPDTDVTLVDPKTQHLKITHLHETFRYPLTDLLVPYTDIASRYGCRHMMASLRFDPDTLQACQAEQRLVINGEALDFDYLIIATGCESQEASHGDGVNVLYLHDFTVTGGAELLTAFLHRSDAPQPVISVVGGGATGIQFLFEIRQFLDRIKHKADLRLIHAGEHVLEQFPAGFAQYVESRMRDMNIVFYPDTYYREQRADKIVLAEKITGKQFELRSDLLLLFLGKKQQNLFTTNAFGQVLVDQKPLPNIFVAGDCSYYQSLGSNTLTAQSAVRKGKLVARNVLRHAGFPGLLEPYLHHELGYVVSLGASDAVGWLVAEGNLITGLSALTIKEVVETQYDLLLAGIDTYLV